MTLIGILKHLKFDNLTNEEKADLKKKLKERKQELETALSAVNRGLQMVESKTKRKAAPKKKTAKRPVPK